MTTEVHECVAVIRARAPAFTPRVGIVLGSGLGGYADQAEPVATIPYATCRAFRYPASRVIPASWCSAASAARGRALSGRAHYYEHGRADVMKVAVRTLAALGCGALVLTNSAGSLRREVEPGSVMLITDHINFTGQSPLFGETGKERFVNMVGAYDAAGAARLTAIAAATGVTLHTGTYMWFSGPQFETPAEIRAAVALGADAVGMSTVPEVILARHAGLTVVALSAITNLGAGMSDEPLSHDHTLRMAAIAAGKISRLLNAFLESYNS